MITFDDLTLSEIEEIELLTGSGIDKAFEDGKPKGRAMRAFVYVAKKRVDPNFKFEDTGKITQKEAAEFLTGENPKD